MKRPALQSSLLLSGLFLLFSNSASATLGVFEHGNGINSMGMGGVTYSYATETTTLGANPAHALSLGDRWDFGADVFWANAEGRYEGNTAGGAPDGEVFTSDGRSWYMIPQGGLSMRLNNDWAYGVTILNAGLGPDFAGNPYRRFGGTPNRATLYLASSSIVNALAYRLTDSFHVGASLNIGYQQLSVQGLQFLDDAAFSVSPGHVTNQGLDGVFTFSAGFGFKWQITPWLTAGAAYKTKNYNAQHDEYRGLVARGGKLELPSIYGGGFTIKPFEKLVVVLEAQRLTYKSEAAFKNGLDEFSVEGNLLGSNDGPGFGFNDLNAYKLGIEYAATPKLTLRGGFLHGTGLLTKDNTFFAFLGCLTHRETYTVGATYLFRDKWELSGMGYATPIRNVQGHNSIPAALGGGEVDIADEVYGFGLSVGKRF
ncbi:MAG: long-chain fatty acid transporter [Panacagrimonas sp.]|nr:outer membrane protein transport protein [Panacagrimonas sp.]MCC2656475.1 long-chain fatty acid transporter [Panacagrimonas sp.]